MLHKLILKLYEWPITACIINTKINEGANLARPSEYQCLLIGVKEDVYFMQNGKEFQIFSVKM